MKTQAWCITDGAAGCISQVNGLASAMGLSFENKKISLRFPWNYCPSGFYPAFDYALKDLRSLDIRSCPKYVLTSGKRSVYASLYLKSRLGNEITTIHIQDPKINSRYFDFVVAPEHDAISGNNVIKTQFAINHITPEILNSAAQDQQHLFDHIRRPLILVVLGGSNRHFHFSEHDIDCMNKIIDNVTEKLSAHAVMLFSRRTPPTIEHLCRHHFSSSKNVTVWKDSSVNPYLSLLAISDYVFLTCDSASMISEAITAQKPTYIYQLPLKKSASRLQTFIDILLTQKTIALLSDPLPICRPVTISETKKVAQRILQLSATAT